MSHRLIQDLEEIKKRNLSCFKGFSKDGSERLLKNCFLKKWYTPLESKNLSHDIAGDIERFIRDDVGVFVAEKALLPSMQPRQRETDYDNMIKWSDISKVPIKQLRKIEREELELDQQDEWEDDEWERSQVPIEEGVPKSERPDKFTEDVSAKWSLGASQGERPKEKKWMVWIIAWTVVTWAIMWGLWWDWQVVDDEKTRSWINSSQPIYEVQTNEEKRAIEDAKRAREAS